MRGARGPTPPFEPARAHRAPSDFEELSDFEWSVLEPLLPSERGRGGRPAFDNRIVVNGIVWQLSTRAPWRDMPEGYGKWNSVYRRYDRWRKSSVWSGVAMFIAQMVARRSPEAAPDAGKSRLPGHAPAPGQAPAPKARRAPRG
jgi:hypothetical protein